MTHVTTRRAGVEKERIKLLKSRSAVYAELEAAGMRSLEMDAHGLRQLRTTLNLTVAMLKSSGTARFSRFAPNVTQAPSKRKKTLRKQRALTAGRQSNAAFFMRRASSRFR